MTTLERARRYLGSLPRAIAGSGGHDATFAAALALVKGFGLPERIALEELCAWNTTHCDPPWSVAELRHKIHSAAQSDKPAGYLLGYGDGAAPRSTCLSDEQITKKAEQRKSWPSFHPLSDTTLAEIAKLRHLSVEAVAIANSAGLLAGAVIDGHKCFVIRESDFAQARRLDGGSLRVADGEAKTKTLWGSAGHFIGRSLLGGQGQTGPAGPILLVEGCIGLLEGIAAALTVDADAAGWTVLAAVGASSRFDAGWLDRFRGRRVRILTDPDPAGLKACAQWTASLRGAGCTVDAFKLPPPHHDLGDLLRDVAAHRAIITDLFTL